ncbi:hypothetical protein EUTSA_v10023830mg, partial [Eutrema salsugineum]
IKRLASSSLLPPELTSSILHRLGAIEILENAQKVCKSWYRVCKDPSMWRKIDMLNFEDVDYDLLEKMCRHAVDLSHGGLVEIDIRNFCTVSLLNYIADSSSNLRSIKLAMCYQITNEGLIEAVVKLPLLEDLEISYCSLSGESLKVVGQSCPNLKTLKKNCVGYRRPRHECDDIALAIAETMSGLRHLQLFGNKLTDAGLNAILDSCPNLEHLDLRQFVRRPNDSIHDYPFDATINDVDSSEDDYPYGFSDVDMVSDDEFYYDLSGASDYDDMFDDYELR